MTSDVASYLSEKSQESRARRVARRNGFAVRKSRWRLGSIDNFGGLQIIDPETRFVVLGVRYDLSPEDVIEYFKD